MEKEKAPLIKILKGPNRGRKRPVILFVLGGLDSSIMVVKGLLDIFIAEEVHRVYSKVDVVFYRNNLTT